MTGVQTCALPILQLSGIGQDWLDLDVSDVKNDDSEYLIESVKKLGHRIKQLKSTYAWKWGNTPDQEREVVKKMILQSLGLAVSVDDIMKEKENGKTAKSIR